MHETQVRHRTTNKRKAKIFSKTRIQKSKACKNSSLQMFPWFVSLALSSDQRLTGWFRVLQFPLKAELSARDNTSHCQALRVETHRSTQRRDGENETRTHSSSRIASPPLDPPSELRWLLNILLNATVNKRATSYSLFCSDRRLD